MTQPKKLLTADFVRSVLAYDALTGAFAWRVRVSGRAAPGDPVGKLRRDGYREVQLKGKKYLLHRLAWLHVTGEWPSDQVDHRDGVRSNNAFANLREATNKQNQENRIGSRGVYFHKTQNSWHAYITHDGSRRHLGSFPLESAALAARKTAEQELFTHRRVS